MKNTDLELHEKYGLKEIESPVMHMEETLRSPTAKVFISNGKYTNLCDGKRKHKPTPLVQTMFIFY